LQDFFVSDKIKCSKKDAEAAPDLLKSLKDLIEAYSDSSEDSSPAKIPTHKKAKKAQKAQKSPRSSPHLNPLLHSHMLTLLQNKQNILLYGLGSKHTLLHSLHSSLKAHFHILYCNSTQPGITLKTLCTNIAKLITTPLLFSPSEKLKSDTNYKSILNAYTQSNHKMPFRVTDQLCWLQRFMAKVNACQSRAARIRFLVVVQQIDVLFADQDFVPFFKRLAGICGVGLLASAESVRVFANCDSPALDALGFVSLNVNTYLDYAVIPNYYAPLFTKNLDVKESGLIYVLKSLTKNHRYAEIGFVFGRDVLKLIGSHQLENPHEKGITNAELFEKALENLILSSQDILKNYLIEARDHKVIDLNN
jgi:hypothetical protein